MAGEPETPRQRSHLDRLDEYLAVLIAVALAVLLTAQVVLRFGFSLGFSWLEEIARVLFVWLIFLGAVVAMRDHAHIRVTVGLLLFPERLRPWVALLGDLVLLAFCIAGAWYGAVLVASTVAQEFRLQSTGISMFWPYIIMPASFALQAVRLVLWRWQQMRSSGA